MRTFAVLLSLLLALSACRPPEETGSIGSTSSDPFGLAQVTAELLGSPRNGDVRVRVEVSQYGLKVDDAQVVVTGNMFHPGMEPVIAEAAFKRDGRYETPPLEFSMAGDWFLAVDVTYPDGSEASESLLLTVWPR
jgi:hypothetical protein